MPVLDRQPARPSAGPPSRGLARDPSSAPLASDPSSPNLPPSLRGLPVRSVPEARPTPLQRQYVTLSVIVLACGAIAITALESGMPLGAPLVKLCVLVGSPVLVVTTIDAAVRIWRSAWAWMPVDRVKGAFRLCWLVVAFVGLAGLVGGSVLVLLA